MRDDGAVVLGWLVILLLIAYAAYDGIALIECFKRRLGIQI